MITSRIYSILYIFFLLISHRVVHAYEQPDLLCVHNFSQLMPQEGFSAGTLVKTPGGYQPIETITHGTVVCAYDLKSGTQTERRVLCTNKVCIVECAHIIYGVETIYAGNKQRFFDQESAQWVEASSLAVGSKNHACLESICVYQLFVEHDHNFYVTKQDILVHNAIPLVFVGAGFASTSAFAAIAAPVAAVAVPVVVSWIIWQSIVSFRQPENTPNKKLDVSSGMCGGGGGGPDDPDDPENNKNKDRKNNKKYEDDERRKKRENYRPLNNKEARLKAKELGYVEDKSPPFDSLDKPTFRKGNDWITSDKYGHKGGVWKRFSGRHRVGTYDQNLSNRIGD